MVRPPPKTFFPFSRLPPELQDAIWEASLPARLVNHNRNVPLNWSNMAAYKIALASSDSSGCANTAPWLVAGAPVAPARGDRAIPGIAHVCRRARAVVLRHGAWMHCPADPARPPAWLDRRRDTVLLEDAAAVDALFPRSGDQGLSRKLTADEIDRMLIGNIDRTAGGLAVPLDLLLDTERRLLIVGVLTSLLRRRGTDYLAGTPLLVYPDEIVLRGRHAADAAAAAAAAGLFHGPVHVPSAAAADVAGRWRYWRLVTLDDTETLQRMLAFCETMARAKQARRRSARDGSAPPTDKDPNVAFFRSRLLPGTYCNNSMSVNIPFHHDDTLDPLVKKLHFEPAVLVWFVVDDKGRA